MKNINKNLTGIAVMLFLMFGFILPATSFAATTPSLGTADPYGLLSSTFTRNVGLTAITGSAGYTTLSGSGTDSVSGTTSQPATVQSGTDQATALSALASQPCNFNFGSPTDLSLLAQPLLPGVYCVTAAASIGTGGLTLNGSGTYIFRINGAFTTVNNSHITLSGGASACDVFWTPTAASTLGANTSFAGTIIDNLGITVGNTTSWLGRALDFATTVTTDTDTITAPTCSAPPTPATINVTKVVVGGTKAISDFLLFVNGTPVVSGVANTFSPGSYTVTETSSANYSAAFSGDCDITGHVSVVAGDSKNCILTNTYTAPPIVTVSPQGGAGLSIPPPIPPLIDVVKVPSPLALPNGPGMVTYTYTLRNIGIVPVSNVTMVDDSCSPLTLVSGDTNKDSKLDVNETWTYTCATNLSATHTNTVVATGWANNISAVAIAKATVVVGASIIPPIIHVTKIPNPLSLLTPGGAVTYTYTITNPGSAPLDAISIMDDKCAGLPGRVLSNPGDTNGDDILEHNEAWSFSCTSNLFSTTTNTVTVVGYDPSGMEAKDFAVATVVVATPSLPKTGFPPKTENNNFNLILISGVLLLILTSIAVWKQKYH